MQVFQMRVEILCIILNALRLFIDLKKTFWRKLILRRSAFLLGEMSRCRSGLFSPICFAMTWRR